ncbi:hypothetical protein IAQ61_010185 [Plenodomus lingam]|uniref:uncharacterized protein n=1 Tax=Leptosphaeria maculans TaxID=5022 RepID=UPI00331A8BA9|nr:hypothetical protein IAQ61_010185 [Plenodomus lingam]
MQRSSLPDTEGNKAWSFSGIDTATSGHVMFEPYYTFCQGLWESLGDLLLFRVVWRRFLDKWAWLEFCYQTPDGTAWGQTLTLTIESFPLHACLISIGRRISILGISCNKTIKTTFVC